MGADDSFTNKRIKAFNIEECFFIKYSRNEPKMQF